ncbi:hypothetical protein [Bacillus sp. SRB1LM]|uniref:hypothetical protein n=1 Tax=Bacillus sp. SRB1LM TaxID=2608688 RepID=UPI0018C43494|nr:hypothetical protein [Bacillus sp. SRB1LM]MBG0964109.1 hypothetical protein [Bacillus sp. SRB1LM]
MLKKGILSLSLCTAVLAVPVSSFAAENELPVQSSESKVILSEHGYTSASDNLKPITKEDKPQYNMQQNVAGGVWTYGQKLNWQLKQAQFSDFNTNDWVHRSTAMANDNYWKTEWKSRGVPANSITDYFWSLNTYRSYYDIMQ